jgi:hypothetical protein
LYSKEKIEKGNFGTDFRIEDFKNKLGKDEKRENEL